MNTLISLFMWGISRNQLYRDLVAIWAAMLLAFIAQGITGDVFAGNHFGIVAGFSTLFVANLAYARLITRVVGEGVPWRSSLALFAVGLCASWVNHAMGGSFTSVAMPAAIG